jgi:DNA polymerase III subunit alpha
MDLFSLRVLTNSSRGFANADSDHTQIELADLIMGFVHLHNRSQYSILDGAMRPGELVGRATELEMGAVALTDTCNLYGAVEFYKAAKSAGIHPVFGSELWVWPEGIDHFNDRTPDGGWNLVLLIESSTGYQNLCKLVTNAIFDGMHFRPRIDLDQLRAHSEGLIVLTGGIHGPLGLSCRDDLDTARERVTALRDILGTDHLFLELSDVGLPGQADANARARTLSAELDLQTVVTNDCRYIHNSDAITLDLLNSIARGESLDAPTRQGLPTDQQYIKTEAEMRALFPEDGDAIERTVEIANRCQFKFKMDTYYFPATRPPDIVEEEGADNPDTDANWAFFYTAFPPPKSYGLPDPEEAIPPRPDGAGNINGFFRWYSAEGLKLRLKRIPEEDHKVYWDRLDFELDVVIQMGFPAYLLIVAEFINWAKDEQIPVGPGRGSGAGSVINWAMAITDIDPIRFGLLFERFLNPERVSMPDIDVDFCQDRREEVITHVRNKYGADLVSQIITYGNLKAKAATKDIARIVGLDFNASNRIAKLIPDDLGITLGDAVREERIAHRIEGDPVVGRLFKLARRIEGMTRQTGVHAAGVVIADRPLVEHAPLYRDGPEGGPVVQYEMKAAEGVGLIKFDFLGLKTLDQIRDAVIMVERNTGEKPDVNDLPLDDEATFALLQRGDGLGVFQVESSGMRELMTRLRPSNIDDLIALLALYRPGPLSSGMVDTFIDCKHGRKAVKYPHPSLEPILASTYGGIVYQEQVMQIAQVLSGYSLGEADLLRRAMGKKKKEEMDKQKTRFVEGAIKNDVDEQLADEIFELLAFFAGYGFNKSHSAAYGMISYQTAWLKAHHRAEYMAALMSIDRNNTDKVLLYIGDCKRAGLSVLPPDVNHSQSRFDVPADNRKQIRFGLAAVKGVGTSAVEAIIEAREAAGGAFENFGDCVERLDYGRVNKKVLESLIKCGAFDWTQQPRHQLFKCIDHAIDVAQKVQADKASAQTSLFGGAMAAQVRRQIRFADVGEWPTAVKLSHEREALGFFITGHPVAAFKDVIDQAASCSIDQLATKPNDSEVTIAGMVSALRKVRTKRGNDMGFVTIEDELGSVECIFFSDPWANARAALTAEVPLLIKGKLEKKSTEDGEECKLIADGAELLSEVRERRTRAVHLMLEREEVLSHMSDLSQLFAESKGKCPVTLHVRMPDLAWVELALSEDMLVVPDDALLQGIEVLTRRSNAVKLT